MAGIDQQSLVTCFLEIAVGQSVDTARQFLELTNWNLEQALQLFYVGGIDQGFAAAAPVHEDVIRQVVDGGRDIRPPLPVTSDVLYGAHSLIGLSHEVDRSEINRSAVWEVGRDFDQDNLSSLYHPPYELMLHGPFENAKYEARMQNKWLLVNVQSTKEFNSHMLNRDTWGNEAVAETIKNNFVFWQINDDTVEGRKVCCYYKMDSLPVVLVIDPITGQKMRYWRGMVQPESLLEDILPYMDGTPSDTDISLSHKRPSQAPIIPLVQNETINVVDKETNNVDDEKLQQALTASMVNDGVELKEEVVDTNTKVEENRNKATYLPLPEEPKGDRTLLCKVGMRLPDGRRVQRSFLRTDPIQLLWSFCVSELKEEDGVRTFKLTTQRIPGASRSTLDVGTQSTFEESGLANSMISVTWE